MTRNPEFTRVTMIDEGRNNLIRISLQGKLTREDYEQFVPEIEHLTEAHGKIRLLVELVDFHGWTAGAVWEDTKFAARHFSDIERLAIVGDSPWEKGMAIFCRPFTRAKVRYFAREDEGQAITWLRETSS